MMGNIVGLAIHLDRHTRQLGFCRLIADEYCDVSNQEQLTCILRCVSFSDMMARKNFIGMYLIEKLDDLTITVSLKDVLLR